MKKITAIIALVMVLVLLVGCATKAPPKEKKEAAPATVSEVEKELGDYETTAQDLDTSDLDNLDKDLADLDKLELG